MSTTNGPAETCVKMFDFCFCSICKAERGATTFAAVREAHQGNRVLAALRVGRQLTEEQAADRRVELETWREQLAAKQGW